jgi:predicted O-methyltransferase YrrM
MNRSDLRARARRLVGELSRLALRERGELAAVEQSVAAALAREVCNDPVFFARFLRQCLVPTTYAVEITRPAVGDDAAALRFRALLAALGSGPPVVAQPVALDLARAADALIERRDAYPVAGFDVGLAARFQSSFGRKGRLLATAARFAVPSVILELGTAYGMSAAFLARAAPGATVLTFEPQSYAVAVAREQLALAGAGAVEVLEQPSSDAAEVLAGRGLTVDLLFHDARHSGDAYIEDFEICAPHLAPGAVVMYDDIRWVRGDGADPRTYDGWTAVAGHARIRASAEVDGAYGLALVG